MRLYIIIILIVLSLGLSAEQLSNNPAAFLDVGLDARAIGMGGAYTALVNDASSFVWNPAGMAYLPKQHSLNFDNTTLLGLYNYSFLGYARKLNTGLSVGSAFIYSGDDAMSENTIYISAATSALFIDNYIFPVPELFKNSSFGMNLKIYSSSYGNNSDGAYYDANNLNHQVNGSAWGFGLDMGMIFKPNPRDCASLFWRNPLNNVFWKSSNEVGTAKGNYSEDLPTQLIAGYAMNAKVYTFSIDVDKAFHDDVEDIVNAGVEWRFIDKMALRGGYSQELLTGANKKYSIGTGFKTIIWKNADFALDIAYQVQGDWDNHNTLRISGKTNF